MTTATAAKFRIRAETGGTTEDEPAQNVTVEGQNLSVSHAVAVTEESTIDLVMKEGALTDHAGNENRERSLRVNNNITKAGHPSAVRNLRAEAGNQRVHLYWDNPEVATAGQEDAYIHKYEYRQKPSPGGWTDWTETPQSPPVNGMTADGLDNGTSYSFQVRAKNRHKRVGPDGQTVSGTPVAHYSLNLSRWGIRRDGDPTEVMFGVGDGPFRETRTYTMLWNGKPTNEGLLHPDNPTTLTLPAGRNGASVELRAAADDDGPNKVYNLEVEYPLVFEENGSKVVQTRPSGLYDGNLSVHDNESKPVISLEAPESVAEGEDFKLTVRMSHRLENDAVVGFGFSNPSRAKWNLSGVPEPQTITVRGIQGGQGKPATLGDLSATSPAMQRPDDEKNHGDTDITFVLDQQGRDDPWTLGDSAQTVRFTDDETEEIEGQTPRFSIEDASGSESDDGTASTLTFTVRLRDEREHRRIVSVDYRTVDKTAKAGEDYVATSGTLWFRPVDDSDVIEVTIKDDAVEDSGETFELVLENPGRGAEIDPRKKKATGTINDGDEGPLAASFPSSPYMSRRHTGSSDRPQVVVEFSEAVASFTKSTPSVSVDNGSIRSVQAHTEDGLEHAYIFILTPEDDHAVRFRLIANKACDAGGICTGTGKLLTEVPATRTIPGPEPTEERTALSVADAEASEEDDATIDFVVTLDPASSTTVTVDYSTEDGTGEAGADYTAKTGTLTFNPGDTSKTVRVALIDDSIEDDGETFTLRLSNASGADIEDGTATGTIRNMEPVLDPLTASFSGMPAEHDGSTEFHFELTFSEEPNIGYKTLRDHAFDVTGGNINEARRQTQGSNLAWRLRVEPYGRNSVSITLPETTSCGRNESVCTEDGRMLSHSTSDNVQGPAGISISDARVEEAAGAVLAFTVTLSRSTGEDVTVDYATSDGTAEAGADYTATSGTLTISAGSSSGTIEVPVLDDAHDDDDETLTLTLSNPTNAVLDDATATGTIDNNDVMPRALMARFGRSAAVHIIDQIEERMKAPRRPGFDGRIAGRNIDRNIGRDFALGFLQQLRGRPGYRGANLAGQGMPQRASQATRATDHQMQPHGAATGPAAQAGPMNALGIRGGARPHQQNATMGLGYSQGQVLTGSSFAMNRETTGGGILSVWSRSAQSRFHGREGVLSLNGDVITSTVGADYAKGRMVTGVAVARSRGSGGYSGEHRGTVSSGITGVYPWIGYKVSERVSVWSVAGYGAGGLLLSPEAGTPIETGLSMAMAAGGGRGRIAGSEQGFALAFKADALWVGTRSEQAHTAGGRLNGTTATVTRLRTALEGAQTITLSERMNLRTTVETGIRQDGGDAETGAGVDVGAGLTLTDAASGLTANVQVRTLVVHEAAGFSERGMAISISYNPTPSTPLGFSARVSPAWGGEAMGGAEGLWRQETMGGISRHGLLDNSGRRLDTELAYGLPIGTRFVGTPRVGLRTSQHGRDYRVGYALKALERRKVSLELAFDAERRERPVAQQLQQARAGADQRVIGRASLGW